MNTMITHGFLRPDHPSGLPTPYKTPLISHYGNPTYPVKKTSSWKLVFKENPKIVFLAYYCDLDTMTQKLISSSLSHDALATTVCRKSVNVYQTYHENKPPNMAFLAYFGHAVALTTSIS